MELLEHDVQAIVSKIVKGVLHVVSPVRGVDESEAEELRDEIVGSDLARDVCHQFEAVYGGRRD